MGTPTAKGTNQPDTDPLPDEALAALMKVL